MKYFHLYSAFTLVEMLIVMGILIILMVIGITAGRFAIKRANAIAHESAVDNVYSSLQAYYTDHREFPPEYPPEGGGGNNVARMVLPGGLLEKYISGEFNPGEDTTYYYAVSDDQQKVLVCVTLWGVGNVNVPDDAQVYCNGNAFGSNELSELIQSNFIDYDSAEYRALGDISITCNWYKSEWQY